MIMPMRPRFDSAKSGVWSFEDTRNFLFDMEESLGCQRVVPDEAVVTVVLEMKLDLDGGSSGVSWVEFKSFCLYLHSDPIKALHGLVQTVVPVDSLQFAVLVTQFSAEVKLEELADSFTDCGDVSKTFVCYSEAEGNQALVCFTAAEGQQAALALNGTLIFADKPVTIAALNSSQFPFFLHKRIPSKSAVAVAKMYVGLKNFNEKHQITATIDKGVDKVLAKWNSFSEEYKLKEKYRKVADKTIATASKVDEKLKISAAGKKIGNKAASVATTVAANPTVAKGVGYVSTGYTKVASAMTGFTQDVKQASDEIWQKQHPQEQQPKQEPKQGEEQQAEEEEEEPKQEEEQGEEDIELPAANEATNQ